MVVVFYEEWSDLAKKLEQIQYKVGLLATGALTNSSQVKILNELGWQPLSERITFHCVSLLYKAVQGTCSHYFSNYIMNILNRDEVNYNLRIRPRLLAPIHCSRRYSKSYIPSSVQVWNSLPLQLQTVNSLEAFKRKYKHTYFLNRKIEGYNVGQRAAKIFHTHFRLGFTCLNHDLALRQIIQEPLCQCNNGSVETYMHFFLRCPLYNEQHNVLFCKITPILISGNAIEAGMDIGNISFELILKLLLYGFEPSRTRLNTPSLQQYRNILLRLEDSQSGYINLFTFRNHRLHRPQTLVLSLIYRLFANLHCFCHLYSKLVIM
jgi:hypothetical protein